MIKIKSLLRSSFIIGLLVTSMGAEANSWLLGLEGGYAFRRFKVDASTANADPATAAATGIPVGAQIGSISERFKDNGSKYGVFLGYELDTHPSNLVGSFELGVLWGNVTDPHYLSYTDSFGAGSQLLAEAKFNRNAMYQLSGRLGIQGPRLWTPYLRLGGVMAREELTYNLQLTQGNFIQSDLMSESKRIWGWLVGVGVEVPLFADSIVPLLQTSVVRLEYNYISTQRLKTDDVVPPFNGVYSAKHSTHLIKAALVFKHRQSNGW